MEYLIEDHLYQLLENLEHCLINFNDPLPLLTKLYSIPSGKLKSNKIKHRCSDILIKLIDYTKSTDKDSEAIAYCIDILNRMDFCFSTKSFSKINARGADLGEAILSNSSFIGVDFRDCNFEDACLFNSILRNCNLLNVFITDVIRKTSNKEYVNSCCVSRNCSLLASANMTPEGKNHSIKIWNLQTGNLDHVFDNFERSITSIVFYKNDSQIVFGNSKGKIEIWDLRNRSKEREIEIDANYVNCLTYQPSGSLLGACGYKYLICVWKNDELIHELIDNYALIPCISFTMNGKYLVSGSRVITIWNLESGEKAYVYKITHNLSFDVTSLSVSPDNSLLAVSYRHLAEIYYVNFEDLNIQRSDLMKQTYHSLLSFSSCGRYLTSTIYNSIHVLNAQTGKSVFKLLGIRYALLSAFFTSLDRYIVSEHVGSTILFWKLRKRLSNYHDLMR